MIVFSDLHLREETEAVVFGQVLPALAAAAAADKVVDGARWLACLGDLWHIRYRVPVVLLNRLLTWAENLWTHGGVRLLILAGNHDQVNPQGEHALEALRRLAHVRVFDQPTWDARGLWVPYRKDQADVQRALALPRPAANMAPVLWIHHGIRGAWRNDRQQDTDGLDPAALQQQGFRRVFAGHYHKPQDLGLVSYVGSPYEVHSDEQGQLKRYGIWDQETLEMTWVPVAWGTRHHKFVLQAGAELDLSQARPGDMVHLVAPVGTQEEAAKLGQQLLERGVRAVVTMQDAAKTDRLAVSAGASLREYGQEYVSKFAGDLDPARLLQMFAEITGAPR
jgi:DNA repair exonuclease SbcCD nuclease subunit